MPRLSTVYRKAVFLHLLTAYIIFLREMNRPEKVSSKPAFRKYHEQERAPAPDNRNDKKQLSFPIVRIAALVL